MGSYRSLPLYFGSPRVEDNDNLTNLTLLPNVTKIGKTFELSFNHGITELHGPPQLHQPRSSNGP